MTTYPGTTEDRVAPRLAEATGLRAPEDYHLVASPERIDPGNPVYSLRNTPRIVGGLGLAAGDAATSFYSSFIDKVHRVSGPREAETAKLLENTYRHVNIALVNEMAIFCEELGIDLWEAIGAASTKPFGFAPFMPGPGVGGHCIPVDPSYLLARTTARLPVPVRRAGRRDQRSDAPLRRVPYRRPAQRRAQVRRRLTHPGARVGLQARPGRPAGVARSRPDPSTGEPRGPGSLARPARPVRKIADSAAVAVEGELRAEELAAADLVVVHTDHSAYDPAMIVRHARQVFDTRNLTAGHRRRMSSASRGGSRRRRGSFERQA